MIGLGAAEHGLGAVTAVPSRPIIDLRGTSCNGGCNTGILCVIQKYGE